MATAAEGLPEAGAQPAKRKGPGVRGGSVAAVGPWWGAGGLCVRAGRKLSQDKEQAAGLWESRAGAECGGDGFRGGER